MSTARTDEIVAAVATWMEQTGRPVHIAGVPQADLPAVKIGTYSIAEPDIITMVDTVARWIGLEFAAVGRDVVDAMWLDERIMALLADPPAQIGTVEILAVVPETAAALEPGTGRMLALHRAALAYR